ncbi:hypothetical protein ACHQM5_021179 [Ranunculus cassubicifolius]
MPQVDLETLVCGGSSNDRKINCETLSDDDNDHPKRPEKLEIPEVSSDFPAESYLVSREDEYDWYDRNAFYERKGSTKGSLSPNNAANTSNFSSSAISFSKRYVMNLKSKASIIGLPKVQKSSYVHRRSNQKPVNAARFFPKTSRSTGGKSTVPLSEPGSPKVSCIGRVRSKRDRTRRLRRQLSKDIPVAPAVKKTGLWKSLKAALNLGGGNRRKQQHRSVGVAAEKEKSSSEKKKITVITSEKFNHTELTEPTTTELTGLAGLKRFSSGRRADSWGGYDVALDLDESDSPPERNNTVWSRRGGGAAMKVYCDRDLGDVGPASI